MCYQESLLTFLRVLGERNNISSFKTEEMARVLSFSDTVQWYSQNTSLSLYQHSQVGGRNIQLDFWGDKKEHIGRDAFYNDLVITSLCNSHVHSPKTARITVRPPSLSL